MIHLIFALFWFASAEELHKDHHHNKFCPYTRRLHALRDNVIPPGTQYNFQDINFAVALSFGCGRLYNASWPAFILKASNDYLMGQFGINWTAGTAVGGGVYVRPEGVYFPYVYGTDFMYRIMSDMVDCKETKPDNNWFIFNTGYLVRHSVAGVYPGGAMNGTTYQVGDIISYTEYNYLNEDKQDKWATDSPKWRQRVIIKSRQPGHSTVNSLGGTDVQVYEELVDQSNGQIGFSSFSVTNTNASRWSGDNHLIQSTRNTMTWPHSQTYPTPMPSQNPCPAPGMPVPAPHHH